MYSPEALDDWGDQGRLARWLKVMMIYVKHYKAEEDEVSLKGTTKSWGKQNGFEDLTDMQTRTDKD